MNLYNKSLIIGLIAFSVSPLTSHANNALAQNQSISHNVDRIKLIDTKTIPYNQTYKETTIGGLSGITYNPQNNKWLAISDDRSEQNPARFYEAKLNYNNDTFNNVKFTKVHTLKQPDGSTYPNKAQYKEKQTGHVVDAESIRIDPLHNQIMYTSEGDRSLGLNPFIRLATTNGNYLSDIPINNTIKMDHRSKKGFRNNLALEGSTFSNNGQTLWTSMEGPLIQDDTLPTPESGALSRITQYDRQGNTLSEFAYPLDAVPEKPGKGRPADNGISEMLAINDHEFLTLERASVQTDDGSYKNFVRIYKINTNKGTDIKNKTSLKHANVKPLKKELIANLNHHDIEKVDNIEGMTFGKKLPNGNDSLVLVVDNNFNKTQKTELLAFEVIPEKN
ncbi:hypothetical protein CW746_05280 [Staphylococcus succinus]|uniref:esterase-like activity of phytase family protein n=1 Tax=Staphylococcus succinus TaxID=61015 RepID=UPI000C332C08|nr:esterase-like activity of phytase family protein [Staphylococcus succinus]PKI23448.1 hypothetical protein CW746_05280 [Staphylococcus succinus]